MRLPLPPVLLALAGSAWTAGQAVLPDMGVEAADRLAAVAGDRSGQALSAALFVVAGGLLVAASALTSRCVPAGAASRLTRAGLVLLGLGGVWLAAGRGAFNLLMYRLADPSVGREAAVAVLTADVGPGFPALVLMLPALLLGPVLLAAGVIRGGAALRGWLALACWLIGVGAFVVSEFSVKSVEVAGLALATVALGLLGASVVHQAPPTPTRQVEPAHQA